MKRVHVVLLCALAACAEPTPVDVTSGTRQDLLGGAGGSNVVGLLSCTPLPYDSATQVIGPAGGTITVSQHQLVIPQGALDSAVAITAVAPPDTVNRVELRPEGLTFHHQAQLTLSYANCTLLSQLLPKRVAYIDDALSILDYVPSLDSFANQAVTGRLDHFSGYAVAW